MEVYWNPQIEKEELHVGQLYIVASVVCVAAHAAAVADDEADEEKQQFSPYPPGA